MTKNKILAVAAAIIIAAGFAWNSAAVRNLNATMNNLITEFQNMRSLMIALDSTEPILNNPETEQNINDKENEDEPSDKAEIPTSIIFSAVSSPQLQPQSSLTITVEKVLFSATENTAHLRVKIFSSESDSFSALEPGLIFSLFNRATGELVQPTGLNGPFGSLPPRSAVAAEIIFSAPAGQTSFIFKMGAGNETKFYEFDFGKKTYKETTVG